MPAKTHPADAFRRALSQFATGITVVTTRSATEEPTGITVNSFNSVSLDPPLVLWSLAFSATTYDVFRHCTHYMVNVLAATQVELAKRFASRGTDKFAKVRWSPTDSGLPRLDGCVAWFECANRSQHEEGDHVILVGRVESFEAAGGPPLVYHNSKYIAGFGNALPPPAAKKK